jgi:hypothetical protein
MEQSARAYLKAMGLRPDDAETSSDKSLLVEHSQTS